MFYFFFTMDSENSTIKIANILIQIDLINKFNKLSKNYKKLLKIWKKMIFWFFNLIQDK